VRRSAFFPFPPFPLLFTISKVPIENTFENGIFSSIYYIVYKVPIENTFENGNRALKRGGLLPGPEEFVANYVDSLREIERGEIRAGWDLDDIVCQTEVRVFEPTRLWAKQKRCLVTAAAFPRKVHGL
jgi:hypothetical protein